MNHDAEQLRPQSLAAPAASPRVSVLMSVYNAGRHLEPAVRSVLAQTLSDFELLLYDDGSTDATPDVLRRLAGEDARVDLRLRPHGNYCDHFNDGIAAARAPYLARADADDLNEPERFAEQAAFLDGHPRVVAVGSRLREIDPFGVELNVTGEADQPAGHAAIERGLLAGSGWAMSHPAAMIRTDALRRIGGYRREFLFTEDADLFLRLAEVGELANLPQPLVRYRRHAKSVTQRHFARQRRRLRTLLAEAHQRRGLPPPPTRDDDADLRPPPAEALLERWGWNALRRGRLDAARSHAAQRLRLRPFSWQSWRLWLCAARGW